MSFQDNFRIVGSMVVVLLTITICGCSADGTKNSQERNENPIEIGSAELSNIDKSSVIYTSENIFRENCITCHSFMNTESSPKGITLQLLNEMSEDSLRKLLDSAKKNKTHKEMFDKTVLDSLYQTLIKKKG